MTISTAKLAVGKISNVKRNAILALACLLLLAQVLPVLYTRWVEDESWYGNSADSLARHGELRMRVFAPPAPQSRFDARPPLPMVTMAGAFRTFGTSLYTARLPFLFFAIAGIFLTYLLGCELRGRMLGLTAAVFLVTDTLYFLASRTARPESMVVAFSVAGILLFLKSQRRNSIPLAFLSGLLVGLGGLAHPNGLAAGIVAGVFALMEFRGSVFRRARPWVFVAGMLLAIGPYIAVEVATPTRRAEFINCWTRGQGQPLSAIPRLELSRYSDFIGMPSGRFQSPVPVPYRLHIAIALLAAAWFLYRYDRELFRKVGTMIGCSILWWAFLRFQSPRYMATGSPYFALLLAGAVLALWERRPQWRNAVVAAASVLLLTGVGANYALSYLYRKADYTGVEKQLKAIIPPDAPVYGALTFWMAMNDHEYFSWNRTPLQYALDHGAAYLILNDRVLLHGSGFGYDDWANIRQTASDFVRSGGASVIGRVPNPFYGDLEVYRVNRASVAP